MGRYLEIQARLINARSTLERATRSFEDTSARYGIEVAIELRLSAVTIATANVASLQKERDRAMLDIVSILPDVDYCY